MSEQREKPFIPCREVLEFLWAYVTGELPPAQAHEFDRHLSRCDSCVSYLDSYRKTIALSHGSFRPETCEPADEELPEDLVQAVLAARRRE